MFPRELAACRIRAMVVAAQAAGSPVMAMSSPAFSDPALTARGAMPGIGQVLVAAALWSTVGVATELVPATQALPQEVVGMARMLFGGAAILVLVLLLRGTLRPALSLDPRRLAWFATAAAVFQLCLFECFQLLGVTATVFFTVCLPPLIGQGWEMLRRGGARDRSDLQALAIAVLGLAVFAGWMPGDAPDRQMLFGIALALAGSVAFVVMTSAARSLSQEVSPVLVAGVGLCLAGIVLALVSLATGGLAVAALPEMDWQVASVLLYLGLGPTALAYVVYCAGMARCRTANVGLIASMVEPALAALLARVLIGELLSPTEIAGCLMLMLAMVVLWQGEEKAAGAGQEILQPVPQGTDGAPGTCDGLVMRGGLVRPHQGETKMSMTHSCVAQMFTDRFQPAQHHDEESSVEIGRRAEIEAWSLKRVVGRLVRRMRAAPDAQVELDAAVRRLAELSPHLLIDVGVDPETGRIAEEGKVLVLARPVQVAEEAAPVALPKVQPVVARAPRLRLPLTVEMPRPLTA
jgi:drug/metabolite transporter, DME family